MNWFIPAYSYSPGLVAIPERHRAKPSWLEPVEGDWIDELVNEQLANKDRT